MMEKAGKVKEKPAGAAIFLPRGRRSRLAIADGHGALRRIRPVAASQRPSAARTVRRPWFHPIGA
jgi:hypothetical protein